jgi:HPt (histidine-containing phosphotransfer) domain-containing protein
MTVFNRAHFDHMTGGDKALQDEVIGLFRKQADAWRDLLAGAEWRDVVHTMKGSARGIGLDRLAAACETAETSKALAPVRTALAEALAALDQLAADQNPGFSR